MSNLRFCDVAARWRGEKGRYVKRSTLATYSLVLDRHLLPVFGDLYAIEEAGVQAMVLEKLSAGLSHKTIKDMLVVLKMVVRYGSKHRLYPHCEWEVRYPTELKRSEVPVLKVTDHRKLMKHVQENFTFRNLGIYICLNTGMRIGEICGLRWSDIDTQGGVIIVSRTIERVYVGNEGERRTELLVSTPKTQSSAREIPITRELMKMLRPLKKVVNDNFYVVSNCEAPTEPRTYRYYYRRLLERLGIPPLKFHGLRHSFATRCIESKCDYKTVSTILGHSNISTTLNMYVHPDMEQKKRCVDKMMRRLSKS